jgi:hypothetical protein
MLRFTPDFAAPNAGPTIDPLPGQITSATPVMMHWFVNRNTFEGKDDSMLSAEDSLMYS